jgi:hypothetical protein
MLPNGDQTALGEILPLAGRPVTWTPFIPRSDVFFPRRRGGGLGALAERED